MSPPWAEYLDTATYEWRHTPRTSPRRARPMRQEAALTAEGWPELERERRVRHVAAEARGYSPKARTEPHRFPAYQVEPPRRLYRTEPSVVYRPVVYEYEDPLPLPPQRRDNNNNNNDTAAAARADEESAARLKRLERQLEEKTLALATARGEDSANRALDESEASRVAVQAEAAELRKALEAAHRALDAQNERAWTRDDVDAAIRDRDAALREVHQLRQQVAEASAAKGRDLESAEVQLSYAELARSRLERENAELRAEKMTLEKDLARHRADCDRTHVDRTVLTEARAESALLVDQLRHEANFLRDQLHVVPPVADDEDRAATAPDHHHLPTGTTPSRRRCPSNARRALRTGAASPPRPCFLVRATPDEICPHCSTYRECSSPRKKYAGKKAPKPGPFHCTCKR